MAPIRSLVPAAFLLASSLVVAAPSARAQGFFYGQGITDYSYTGYGSTRGSYGFGGIGPRYYGQGFVTGGVYGVPYGGVYGVPYGGVYGIPYGGAYGVPMYPAPPMNYSPPVYRPYQRPTGNGWGAVNGISPMVPRLDAALPQLSPRVPGLR